jgi:hypothetical protein
MPGQSVGPTGPRSPNAEEILEFRKLFRGGTCRKLDSPCHGSKPTLEGLLKAWLDSNFAPFVPWTDGLLMSSHRQSLLGKMPVVLRRILVVSEMIKVVVRDFHSALRALIDRGRIEHTGFRTLQDNPPNLV